MWTKGIQNARQRSVSLIGFVESWIISVWTDERTRIVWIWLSLFPHTKHNNKQCLIHATYTNTLTQRSELNINKSRFCFTISLVFRSNAASIRINLHFRMWLCIEIQNPFLLSADIPFRQFLLLSMRVEVELSFSFFSSVASNMRTAKCVIRWWVLILAHNTVRDVYESV